jgi:hypothetical protein
MAKQITSSRRGSGRWRTREVFSDGDIRSNGNSRKNRGSQILNIKYVKLMISNPCDLCLAKTSYTRRMNDLRKTGFRFFRYNSCHDCVASTFPRLVGRLVSVFRSREDLVLENLALRRQLLALHAQQPRRRLTALHKLFWVALRTFWSGWTKPLILVTPRLRPVKLVIVIVHWKKFSSNRTSSPMTSTLVAIAGRQRPVM